MVTVNQAIDNARTSGCATQPVVDHTFKTGQVTITIALSREEEEVYNRFSKGLNPNQTVEDALEAGGFTQEEKEKINNVWIGPHGKP